MEPVAKPKISDYPEYLVAVLERLKKISASNSLDVCLNRDYLEGHQLMILIAVKYFNTKKINLNLDEETISHMFTVRTADLKIQLYNWQDSFRFKALRHIEDDENMASSITIDFKLRKESAKPKTLQCQIEAEQHNRVIKSTILRQEEEIEKMCHFAEQYKQIWHEFSHEMDDFIENSLLKEHYSEEYLLNRRTEILDCFTNTFKHNGLLLQMDYESSYLFQQLFTNEKERPSDLFNAILSNPILDAKRCDVSFVKRIMVLRCEQMAYNASFLRNLLDTQNEILSNPKEYKEILKEEKNKLVDVCALIFNTRCKSITILKKAPYLEIMKLLKDNEMLASKLLYFENREKIRSFAREEEMEALCKEKIARMLDEITGNDIQTEQNLNHSISDRSMDLSNKYPGIELSCNMIKACVTKVIEDAKIKEGMPDLVLGLKHINLNEIDQYTFPPDMRTEETALLIRDHKQLNIPVTLLQCKSGERVLSQAIVPCILRYPNDVSSNIVSHDNTRPDTLITKKKRKRAVSNDNKVTKKICLVAKKNENDKDSYDAENDILTVVVETKRIDTADYNEFKTCPVCNKARLLKSFCQNVNTESKYTYERNVCNSCRVKYTNK